MGYIYDLHVHSKECSACAGSTAAELVVASKKAGYSGFVLTNHFLSDNHCVPLDLSWEGKMKCYWNAYLDAKKKGDEMDFDVMFGMEHNYGGGREILLYGIDLDFLVNNPDMLEITAEELCDRVHAVGGFVSHAHPYRSADYIDNSMPFVDFGHLDGIEVFNGANQEKDNEPAAELCDKLGLIPTAGNDLHVDWRINARPIGGIEFETRIRNLAELISALKKRKSKVWIKKEW